MSRPDEVFEQLNCDLGMRPAGAPGFDDMAAAIILVEREGSLLRVFYEAGAAETVRGFVEAERLCCADFRWTVDEAASFVEVEAAPGQVELLEQMFARGS